MMGTPGPADLARVTALPLTGLLLASLRVTVMVEVAEPSAATVTGLADTVLSPALTAPAAKVTEAVCVMTRFPSLVSVAWNVSRPAVVDLTVNVV